MDDAVHADQVHAPPRHQEVPSKMEDEDGEVERCCRICRGPEEEEVGGEEAGEALGKLIRPCACKGSLLYVHEKCQEMWIKTYIRRSDKKPACEVCGQQFRISFTQPHKGLAGFLFSSQSPPLVHAIYLSLLYIGLYCLFLFAAEHHTKLAAFCVMVAVGVGASAAIFYLIAFREVDRQVLVYYIVPTFVFAIVIFSQFMGYASLYYKWLSYPGLSLEEDLEYKAFLQQMTWKSSMGVLLEGISSTSIVLNIGLLLCVSSVRLYNFLRHLRRHGGSLANVWMTAPDSTRATIIGSVQLCIFCWFYVCGPTGKCAVFLVYVAFVAAVNWLLRSRFSRNVDTGLCRLALVMGYGFVGTVLAGIGITHYLALLADADVEASSAANSAAPMDQLAGETQVALPEEAEIADELAATRQQNGDDVVDELAHATSEHGPGFPFSFHPTLMSRKMAGNFVRFLYDKSARDDHYEYWNQVYYVSFFLFQTLGIFGVAIWVHVRAVWDHFKDWQNVRRQQQLMLLRDELLFKLNGMEQQHRTLVDSVRNNLPARHADPLAAAQPAPAPASTDGGDEPTYGDVHAHLRRRQQLDREPRLAPTDHVDLVTREAETALRRVQSNLGHLEDSEEEEELYGADEVKEEQPGELGNEEEIEEIAGGEADVDVDMFTREAAEKGKEKVDTDAEADDEVGQATAAAATSAPSPHATAQGAPLDAPEATAAAAAAAADEDEIGNRLQAGAREFVSGVRSIDELVTQYLRERRTESQAGLFAQYLRTHLSPFTAPEKVRMVYATLAYLVLFNSVYFSLVVIDQDEVRKVWLRYVMDCVGMISILFFIHFNYLTGAPNHNFNNLNILHNLNVDNNVQNQPNANNDDDGENRNGNNAGRNYGLLLIGHAVLYFVLLFVWIVLRPATFFDPSLRLSHDAAAAAGADVISSTNGTTADAASDEYASELPADLVDALLMERSGAVAVDPYTLHSLKVVSLLLFVSVVEYGLIGLGLTARRLVRIYRIWLNTGTGHFVVHDVAEPPTAPDDAGAPAPPQPQQPLPPQQRRGEEDEREREADRGDEVEEEEQEESQRLRRRRTAAAGAE